VHLPAQAKATESISRLYAALDAFIGERQAIEGVGRGQVNESSTGSQGDAKYYHEAARPDLNEVSKKKDNTDVRK